MKKEDLVVGQKYVVTHGPDYGTGRKYHEFHVGEVVTCEHTIGGYHGEPQFKNTNGKTQFLKLEQVEPQKPVVEVKVGDKVRIINEGSNSSNGKFYRVGHVGVVLYVYDRTIRVDLSAYGLPLDMSSVDFGDFEVITVDPVAELKTAYDNAKTAYETAVREQKEAEAKEALKFTEDDVKKFMFVETGFGELRLVVTSNGKTTFWEADGSRANHCDRTELVTVLNMTYKKTTKTLKDFAECLNSLTTSSLAPLLV